MKKFLSVLFAVFLMAGNAMAAVLTDVATNHWAATEIAYCVKEGIIKPYSDGSFRPETTVKRSEFNSMLLRALGHLPVEITDKNTFKDLNNNYWAYSDILKSEQLGLLYGYPDKTFKPEALITKAEVASIISHITKKSVENVGILNQFTDGDDVPDWGKNQFAKSVELGIYVNYPDAAYLLPNKILNRAEAAVILYRLRMAMGAVQEKYVAKEITMGTEHLNIDANAANNKVTVTNFRKIVLAGNVLRANFAEDFNSKQSDVGAPVNFTFANDVYTEEGSLIIPRGSILSAVVESLEPQKVFNKNAKVTVTFNEITFPSGRTAPIEGHVIDNNGILTASKLATFGKLAGYTLGGAAIGAGSGVGIAAIPDPKKYGTGVAVGLPVGAGAGLVTGLVTPGLPFKADVADSLLIELTQDFSIYEDESL